MASDKNVIIRDLILNLDKLKEQLKGLKEEFVNGMSSSNEIISESELRNVEKYVDNLRRYFKEVRKEGDSFGRYNRDIKSFNKEIESISKSNKKIRRDLSSYSKDFEKLRRDSKKNQDIYKEQMNTFDKILSDSSSAQKMDKESLNNLRKESSIMRNNMHNEIKSLENQKKLVKNDREREQIRREQEKLQSNISKIDRKSHNLKRGELRNFENSIGRNRISREFKLNKRMSNLEKFYNRMERKQKSRQFGAGVARFMKTGLMGAAYNPLDNALETLNFTINLLVDAIVKVFSSKYQRSGGKEGKFGGIVGNLIEAANRGREFNFELMTKFGMAGQDLYSSLARDVVRYQVLFARDRSKISQDNTFRTLTSMSESFRSREGVSIPLEEITPALGAVGGMAPRGQRFTQGQAEKSLKRMWVYSKMMGQEISESVSVFTRFGDLLKGGSDKSMRYGSMLMSAAITSNFGLQRFQDLVMDATGPMTFYRDYIPEVIRSVEMASKSGIYTKSMLEGLNETFSSLLERTEDNIGIMYANNPDAVMAALESSISTMDGEQREFYQEALDRVGRGIMIESDLQNLSRILGPSQRALLLAQQIMGNNLMSMDLDDPLQRRRFMSEAVSSTRGGMFSESDMAYFISLQRQMKNGDISGDFGTAMVQMAEAGSNIDMAMDSFEDTAYDIYEVTTDANRQIVANLQEIILNSGRKISDVAEEMSSIIKIFESQERIFTVFPKLVDMMVEFQTGMARSVFESAGDSGVVVDDILVLTE